MGASLKDLSHEHQAFSLMAVNIALPAVKWVISAIEPFLSPLLTLAQIVIAVLTAVWIWRRAKGARLDNQIKERDLKERQK
jgi:hypothetical protein